MPDPVIKKEQSPEASVMAMPPMSTAVSTAITLTAPAISMSDTEDVKPPKLRPKPYIVVEQTHVAPSAYYGSSPRKYRLSGRSNPSTRVFARAPPILARLPSRATSATATGRVNKPNITTTNLAKTPTLSSIKKILEEIGKLTNKKHNRMNEHDSGGGAAGNEMSYSVLPPMMNMQDGVDETVTMTRSDLENIRGHLQMLQNATATSEQHVSEQRLVIGELVTFNHSIHTMVQQLDNRMVKVEYDNTNLRSMLTSHSDFTNGVPQSAPAVRPTWHRSGTGRRSRSPSPTQLEYRDRAGWEGGESIPTGTVSSDVKKTKARKQLQIQIPGKISAPSFAAGLPTPLTRTATTLSAGPSALSSSFPKTPITPGRIGPNSNKKSATAINKRKIHNLDKLVPPTYAQIPIVPLTDTEVIVYFFQSLARPIVALRLYARNWGPASIVDVLNEHRDISPPYLRNTASVKCTTAIKKGRDKFGDEWEDAHREVFRKADDVKATDLIYLSGDEVDLAVDYDVRSLSVGLRKHPKDGVDGGIFTRCVKYCHETGAPYTLFNVWQLAADLQEGRVPQHPPSPIAPGVTPRFRRGQLKLDDTDDDYEDIPSPTPRRKVIAPQRRRRGNINTYTSAASDSSMGYEDDAAM
ncbi:uncharacterized protein K460DRAFT_350691 [Cucurbitaria berberidis CBS 394.84]|uniref:Uncharacterized protein n=1 Tax=Cucurbitaria berberidis CBS 394.84 TaxID=1168544 RepID=A0A9P4GQB1_9PLEO|nr:uncharacterized protein K460DRAFT_350691 [Cucurbitaria berberidis CBS 394.84]KAF1850663.1 hypothetical protein K460DRAFT_350691 [Cucurbitaria berberidis CBS 394.84]